MFIYWFGTDRGQNNKRVIVEEVKDSDTKLDYRNSNCIVARLDKNGPINSYMKPNNGKLFIRIGREEGSVYKRAFWLKTLDYGKAEDIINNYLFEKTKALEKQLEKLKR